MEKNFLRDTLRAAIEAHPDRLKAMIKAKSAYIERNSLRRIPNISAKCYAKVLVRFLSLSLSSACISY